MPNSVACVVVTNVSPVYENPFSLSARIFILTLLAMIAFASNSLLCRAALKQTSIDAASFTFIRIFSGAVALWLIVNVRRIVGAASVIRVGGNWISALALFLYAAAFSFAYVDIAAGTGALLLFGAVQATMILWGFHKGEQLRAIQIVWLIIAVMGLNVRVLSATGGILLLGEPLTLRYLCASVAILGGIAFVVFEKTRGCADL